jgi:hypothetical protein
MPPQVVDPDVFIALLNQGHDLAERYLEVRVDNSLNNGLAKVEQYFEGDMYDIFEVGTRVGTRFLLV